MICPLCEHVQDDGVQCDVCGRSLAAEAPPIPPGARLDGLELTVLEGAGGPVPTVDSGEWLDPTREPAAALEIGPEIPDLERAAVEPPGPSTGAGAGAIICRYCRTPAAMGDVFCGRCGMKLLVYRSRADAPEPLATRCRACGATVAGASACPVCGARAAAEDR